MFVHGYKYLDPNGDYIDLRVYEREDGVIIRTERNLRTNEETISEFLMHTFSDGTTMTYRRLDNDKGEL